MSNKERSEPLEGEDATRKLKRLTRKHLKDLSESMNKLCDAEQLEILAKLGIVDTGFYKGNEYIAPLVTHLVDCCRNFIPEDPNDPNSTVDPDDLQDNVGHGSLCVCHVGRIYQRLRLCIAKVSKDGTLDKKGAGRVAQAIMWLVDECKVHMIVLPLGTKTGYQVVEDAVSHAETKRVMVIAAAGNSGPRTTCMHPASMQNVIRVYAADMDGNAAWFNPKIWDKFRDFSAVGVNIGFPFDKKLHHGSSFSAIEVALVCAAIWSLDQSAAPELDEREEGVEALKGWITRPGNMKRVLLHLGTVVDGLCFIGCEIFEGNYNKATLFAAVRRARYNLR